MIALKNFSKLVINVVVQNGRIKQLKLPNSDDKIIRFKFGLEYIILDIMIRMLKSIKKLVKSTCSM